LGVLPGVLDAMAATVFWGCVRRGREGAFGEKSARVGGVIVIMYTCSLAGTAPFGGGANSFGGEGGGGGV